MSSRCADQTAAYVLAVADLAAAETLQEINRVLYRHAGGAWCCLTIADVQRLHAAADARRKEVLSYVNDTL